jgi:hypothetical protein
MRARGATSACPGPCDTVKTVQRVMVVLVLAGVVLAAVLVCPCAAMTGEAHGCCADDGPSIGPSACCRPEGPAPTTPGATAAAPAASFAPVAVSVTARAASALPLLSSVSFPASPPRVLRI